MWTARLAFGASSVDARLGALRAVAVGGAVPHLSARHFGYGHAFEPHTGFRLLADVRGVTAVAAAAVVGAWAAAAVWSAAFLAV